MRRELRAVVLACLLAGLGLTAGFYVFARKVASYRADSSQAADAVVVLTGGEDRIGAGANLVAAKQGQRMLVSGVNPMHASPVELARRINVNEAVFRCCVDLGYGALDTIGNADEARRWVEHWGFHSLIIVTSSYHMPRSLTEFTRAMPGVVLYPYPVGTRHFRLSTWWQHLPTARLLVSEYVKYLVARSKLAVARLTGEVAYRQPQDSRPLARTDRS